MWVLELNLTFGGKPHVSLSVMSVHVLRTGSNTSDQGVKEHMSLLKYPGLLMFTKKTALTFFFCMYFRISKVCLISGI